MTGQYDAEEKDIENISQRIRDVKSATLLMGDRSRLVVYGAGNFGKDVFAVAVRKGFTVRCFLDRRAETGEQWQGVPILNPGDEGIPVEERGQVAVIVAIHNRDVELLPVVEALKALGYIHVITPVEFYDFWGDELGDRYWLTSRSYYRQHEEAIAEGFTVWADEASRSLYRTILSYRVTGQYEKLPVPDVCRQYAPADIPLWKSPLRFIDCGAFDGDTIRKFLELGIPIEAVAAFEPDPDNFRKLSDFIGKQGRGFPDAMLWPCGVHASTARLAFSSAGESAKLSFRGEKTIQCVSLDEAIPRFRPNLIKMNIEGAEYDALLGAEKIIRQNIPWLAICVYHHPSHLWRIPLLVRQWGCGYWFYLRLHACNGFDLVMYAVREGSKISS